MAGKYRSYPEYKDSGIEWFERIPESWSVEPFKWQIDRNDGGVWGDDPDGVDDTFVLRSTEQTVGGYWQLIDPAPRKLTLTEKEFALLKAGDLVITKSSGSSLHIGKTTLVSSDIEDLGCCYSNFMQRVRTKSTLIPKLAWYVMNNNLVRRQFDFLSSTTTGLANLNSTMIGQILLAVPPINEQQVIVSHLDHETAKIDTLIEKQQQLIKLLQEKRQAVISHAVTKGLNPNAPMRDSGVEWLGEVPEHWTISKFGYISLVVRGGSPRPAGDPALFNGDYSPWVTVAEITKDDEIYLTETETFLTKKGSEQCRIFSKGTLLLSNSGATLGVPKILSIDANANDGVVGFENLRLDHEFAYFYLSTLTEDLRERIKQGSGQPNLNTDIVKGISVPIPPVNEVLEIVEAIKNIREKYGELISKATKGIELLQERRTALISAAVTGKIDVRDWQPPAAAEAAA